MATRNVYGTIYNGSRNSGFNPRKLRHVINFQERSKKQDSFGAMVNTWTDVFKHVPAAVEPVSGRDFIASAEMRYPVTTRFVIRYNPEIKPTMRIMYRNSVYTISAILEDATTGLEYLTILASTGLVE